MSRPGGAEGLGSAAPFAPIRPILSPGLSAMSAPSSSVLAPRRSVTRERRIMSVRFARRALYAERLRRRARYLASVLLMDRRDRFRKDWEIHARRCASLFDVQRRQ